MPPSANNPPPDPPSSSTEALGDELLSAYVDGELSDDERRAVETRLAEDPAARRTVAEFRQLSVAFGELPAESAPADVAAAVVDQLAKPSAERAAILPQHDPLPTFQLHRRWLWAGTAIAASYLIMLFYGGGGPGNDLGEIAKAPAEAASPEAETPTVEGSRDEDARAAFSAAEPADEQLDGQLVGDAEMPDGVASEAAIVASAPPVRASSASPAVPLAARALAPASTVLPPQAIVRLGLGDNALSNRAFEEVLLSNAIAVESSLPPRAVVSQITAAGAKLQTDNTTRDYVFLDAALSAVEQCLADLNNDTSNFTRVQVEPNSAPRQQALADSVLELQQLQQQRVEPWRSYNRTGPLAGAAPQQAARKRVANQRFAKSDGQPARLGCAYRFSSVAQADLAKQAPEVPVADPGPAVTGERVQVLFVLEANKPQPPASKSE